MNLGFQNILCILGPYVVYTISTEHCYCFTRRHAVFTLLSNMTPNMFVVNMMAFIVSEYLLL